MGGDGESLHWLLENCLSWRSARLLWPGHCLLQIWPWRQPRARYPPSHPPTTPTAQRSHLGMTPHTEEKYRLPTQKQARARYIHFPLPATSAAQRSHLKMKKTKVCLKVRGWGSPPPLRTNSDTLVLHDFRNKTKEITWNADQLKNINLRISWRYISLANKVMLQCNIVTISYHSMTFFLSGQIPISSSNGMFDDLDDLETGYEVCSSENSFIHIYMEALTVVWRHNIRYMISRNRD